MYFSRRSPGFGLTLVAETNNGVFLCAECASNPKGSEDGVTIPEDLGKKASFLLLEEIYRVSDPAPRGKQNHSKMSLNFKP